MLFWILCWRRRVWRSACVVAEKIHGFCVERNNLCDQRWSTFIRMLIFSHASLYCHIYDVVITADLHEALRRNSRQVKRHEEWDVSYARQRPESKKEKNCEVGNLVQVYRFFLQLVELCISRKPLNKDYLYVQGRRPAIPEQGRQRSNVQSDAGRTCTHLKHIIEAIEECGKYLKNLKHDFTNDDF